MATYLNNVRAATEKRIRILWNIMNSESLDSIILFEGDPVAFKIALTNHFNICIVTRNSIHVFADPTLYGEALEESPWDVVLIEDFSLGELIERVLGLLRVLAGNRKLVVGVNKMWGRTSLSFLYADLLEVLHARGVEVVDATRILAGVFNKPFEEELVVLEWISSVTSKALHAVEEVLKPGVRECEVAAIADKVLDENGILDRWFATIVASGPRSATPHAKTSRRRIGYGEPVIVDLGPRWMGYDGCVAYTYIAGRDAYWERVLSDVIEAVKTGLKHVKPGTPVKTLDLAPREYLAKQGYPSYPHLTGHPIGGFYKPVIAEFIDYSLEENMAFAYEPAVYFPGKGGVRVEPHVLVTDQGYKVFTEYHRKILS